MDRPRYDSAMFWLAFGTAAAVIGLALMTIGATRSGPGDNLFASPWFDGGLGLLAVGVLLLVWALRLYLFRRRVDAVVKPGGESIAGSESPLVEAVRGYYRERDNLFRMWQKEQREKRKNRR